MRLREGAGRMVRAFAFRPGGGAGGGCGIEYLGQDEVQGDSVVNRRASGWGRIVLPLIFGLAGAAILIGLGTWQVQRLAWKQGVLAEIGARILDAPVALPAAPDPAADRYLSVAVEGRLTGEGLEVLVSRKRIGPGYRVIAVLETGPEAGGGRRILIDRGFLPEAARGAARPEGGTAITGNLHWPDEVDSFTPEPDAATGLWFARDLPAMAAALGTEAVLVVQRDPTPLDGAVEPMPVDTASIPNDHLQYAVTWYLLALVWLGMTGLFVWRIWQRRE